MGSSTRRSLLSSLIVPFAVLVVVPMATLLLTSPANRSWAHDPPLSGIVSFFGLVLVLLGLILFIAAVRLFSQHGEGTIMPWNPTQRLVVQGVYRYVRNPMHSGVFLVLFGEGLLLRLVPLLILTAAVVLLHFLYIPLSEERGLEERFGEDYREYKRNVPRWIPRFTPWEPRSQEQDRTP